MPCFAVHEALLALGVAQGDELHSAVEVGDGGFEVVHRGEVELLDAVADKGRRKGRERGLGRDAWAGGEREGGREGGKLTVGTFG